MTDCSMCNSGLNDLATSSYNKRLHKEAKARAEYAKREKELQKSFAIKTPRKKSATPTKSVQEISCPSDKFTGGCSRTTYKYPNGTERVVITHKVAKPAKKKVVTSIGTFTSVAAYKKAKTALDKKIKRQTELEHKKAIREKKIELNKTKKLEAQRKRLNAKRLKGIKSKEKAIKADERKQKQELARYEQALKQTKPRKSKQFKNTDRTRIGA